MTVDPTADLVLVVDYGAQYAQLIARRVREAQVYSEIVPHDTPVADILARRPKAVILSGGPSSVYAAGAPQAPTELITAGVPTLGICYGFQAMAQALGGPVARTGRSEFGRTPLSVVGAGGVLGLRRDRCRMSHGDAVSAAPPGFAVTASTPDSPVAAFEYAVPRAVRRAVPPRGAAHRGRAARSSSGSSTTAPAAVHCGPRRTSSRSRSRRSAPRSAASG